MHMWPLNVVTNYLVCNMAAGVHQDRMRREPLQGMADQTNVGMEKEDHGRMTSTDCRVWFKIIYEMLLCFFCAPIQNWANWPRRWMPKLSRWPDFYGNVVRRPRASIRSARVPQAANFCRWVGHPGFHGLGSPKLCLHHGPVNLWCHESVQSVIWVMSTLDGWYPKINKSLAWVNWISLNGFGNFLIQDSNWARCQISNFRQWSH